MIALTVVITIAEIAARLIFGAMALRAHGGHMGIRAAERGITVMAAWLAQHNSLWHIRHDLAKAGGKIYFLPTHH